MKHTSLSSSKSAELIFNSCDKCKEFEVEESLTRPDKRRNTGTPFLEGVSDLFGEGSCE